MSLSLVETAIITRLRADATLVALMPTGSNTYISTNLGPSTSVYPYVVLEVTDEENSNAFQSDGTEFTATIHILDNLQNGQVPSRTIIERIRGEASRTPSYGLNRHSLVLSGSEWTGSVMLRRSGTTQHDRDTLHYIETFTGHTTRVVSGS